MVRTTLKLVFLAALVIAGTVGLYTYERHNSVQHQLEDQKLKTQQLREVVGHLQAERRVADVIVTDRTEIAGVPHTTLLFVEYARDGSPLPGKRFTFEGEQAHVDAMAVIFDGKFVESRDPLRGQSIALFTRLFGDRQTPENAHRIDDPNHIPAIYRGVDPRLSEFEQELWRDFWRLVDDPAYRAAMGVRVAQGEGVWGKFVPGKLYTLTVQNNGGLLLSSEPLKGIYSEALKPSTQTSTVK